MAEVVNHAQQEFWRSSTSPQTDIEAPLPAAVPHLEDACLNCGGEFMIGARFCHTCGRARARFVSGPAESADSTPLGSLRKRCGAWARELAHSLEAYWQEASFPEWLRYLHFHEIQRWVGLPTAALVAFMIGLGCIAGALGVGFFYRASNLAEFQAIQMWRIEWLLAATAAFVAGILLKKPSDDRD
jgi:hypothetical protein